MSFFTALVPGFCLQWCSCSVVTLLYYIYYLTFVIGPALHKKLCYNTVKSELQSHSGSDFQYAKSTVCTAHVTFQTNIRHVMYLGKISCSIIEWEHIYINVYLTIKPTLFFLPIFNCYSFFLSTPPLSHVHTRCVCGDLIRLAALHTSSAANNHVLGIYGPIKDFLFIKMSCSSDSLVMRWNTVSDHLC